GQAFKCLQEHLQDVGMGAACKGEVNLQEARHASNYRLDVRVRKECEDDVTKFCNGVDAGQEGHALVLKCMVGSFKSLSASCQSEVSYAVRMALFQYHKGAALTQPCDTAVEELCNTGSAAAATTPVKEINGAVIGVYGQCLVSQKRQRLPEECRRLVKLVAKEGAYVGGTVDQNKLEETLMKLKALHEAAAAATTADGGRIVAHDTGLVISGWLAAAALAAVVIVAIAIGCAVYHRLFSPVALNSTNHLTPTPPCLLLLSMCSPPSPPLSLSKQLQEAATAATTADGGRVVPHDTGLVISGWLAAAALAAVVIVAIAIGCAVYYRFFSPTRNYTLVVKSAPGAVGV
ncbi:unnamed protein product, partial [Closterium sp. NIES-53]